MSAATLLAVIAATGITYDWRPVDDPQGGHEYVVTVESDLMQATVDGRAKTLESNVPPEVKNLRRVRIVLGDGSTETVAQADAESDMVPLRHLVAKPVNLADEPIKHSVHQQPYPPQTNPPQNDLYQGFQDVTAQQRRTIGSEIAKGTGKLVDGTGRVIHNTGEAIEGTARNVRDGFRSVVTPTQPQTQPIAAAQPGGYQPYSYNQPSNAVPVYGAQSTYPPSGSTTGSPPPLPLNTNPTQYNTPTGQQPNPSQPNWNSTANSQQPSNQFSTPQPQQQSGNNYAGRQYPNQGSDAYVDLVNPRGTPAGNGMVNLQNTQSTQDSRYNNTPNYRNTASQTPSQQPNYPQNAPNPNATAGARDSFGDWPTTPTSTVGNTYTPPAQQQTNYPANNQPGTNPSDWPPLGGPSQGQGQIPPASTVNNQGQPGTQIPTVTQPGPQTNTWFPLVLVAAIGSIAWNFYLGMNYIDARNKYRAALRRSGKAYAEAFDDV